MSMITILTIYLAVNIFIAGYDIGAGNPKNTFEVVFVIIFDLLFGGLIGVASFIWFNLVKISDYFQFKFFWFYFFTKMYDNRTEEQMIQTNVWATYFQKDTFADKLRRYTVELVNKRNKYTPKKLEKLNTIEDV